MAIKDEEKTEEKAEEKKEEWLTNLAEVDSLKNNNNNDRSKLMIKINLNWFFNQVYINWFYI